MGSGKLYANINFTGRNVSGRRFIRRFLLSSLLLLGMQMVASAAPTFVGGFMQNLIVCQNAVNVPIDYLLGVNDPTVGNTLTWDVVPVSGVGTFAGLPTTMPSGGSGIQPTGVTYSPVPGFVGPVAFTITVSDGVGGTASTTIQVDVRALPSMTLGSFPAICAGTTTATISYSGLTGVGPVTQVFPYTAPPASNPSQWTVPAGVNTITVDVQGGGGGSDNASGAANPGFGGRVQGNIAVVPGQVLNIFVGGRGGDGTTAGAAGGFNGGGNTSYYPGVGCGGAGGGASDIRIGGLGLSNRVIVAGGGGGNGWDGPHGPYYGGAGGDLVAGNSEANVGGSSAGGGTQSAGGIAAVLAGWSSGTSGTLGLGGDGSIQGVSGGGGGGYYGGGAGVWNGGGGGSSYSDPSTTSLISHTQGYNPGDGQIAIHYIFAGTYSITWAGDAAAVTAGFADVNNALLTGSPLSFPVPASAAAGTYNGVVTINNGMCTSTSYPISVTINAIPTVNPISSQSVCNGGTTTAVNFTGAVTPAVYYWMNDNTSISLAGNDSVNIPAFTATNTTANPVTANITVTPVANNCVGTPLTFQITVNPTPMLSTALTVPVCDSMLFSYNPASATATTTFAWERAAVTDIANIAGSGSGNPMEYLDNTSVNPVAVAYVYTLTANACTNVQTVAVTVNPTPMLTTTLTPAGLCPGTVFNYTPLSATTGTAFKWTRNIATGITNPVDSGMGNPGELLNNVSVVTVPVPYSFILTANGCMNIQTVTVNAYPTPMMTSVRTLSPICSGGTISYTPTSGTPGATFQYNRPPVYGLPLGGIVNNSSPISDLLTDTINTPITVVYQITPIANGCSGVEADVSVIVNPIPHLTSPNSYTVCDGTAINYTSTSNVAGANFTWSRAVVAGITNNAGFGVGNITETLHDTTSASATAFYKFTVEANGCSDTSSTIKVTVNPTPKLTSTLTPPSICDSTLFNYTPTSRTTLATFTWTRPYVAGIANAPVTRTGNVNEPLFNTTNVNVDVVYSFTVSASGCNSQPYTVGLTVHPTPKLSSKLSNVVCSDIPFTYLPSSYTSGATFKWNRPAVTGINDGNTQHGVGGFTEILVNSTTTALTVIYQFRAMANGCENLNPQIVRLLVNPNPTGYHISGDFVGDVCSHAMNQLFSTEEPQANGVKYEWSAYNGEIWSISDDKQNAYVNFPEAGNAAVTVKATILATGCNRQSTANVNVGDGIADNPRVIYYNGHFICLQVQEATYQWGYDDNTTYQSSNIDGAINQDYTLQNPDFDNKHYWVKTTRNGCTQKSFYNAPSGPAVQHRNANPSMRIFPNPVNNDLNVELLNADAGNTSFEIINMLGQKMITTTSANLKSVINATNLVPGGYMIDCYRDGVKIATSRFIKN